MSKTPVNLGLCFTDRQVYYALSEPGNEGSLVKIGRFEFNFEVIHAIETRDENSFPAILGAAERLKKEIDVNQARLVIPASSECWSMLPKLVYDQPNEREAYLKILMHGVNRQAIQPYWFPLSNRDYKLLMMRNKQQMDGYRQFGETFREFELCSEFEIGQKWIQHTKNRETFLTVGCYEGYLSLGSYMMGKLRAATWIAYDQLADLPYLWLNLSNQLTWLGGLHDETIVYGKSTWSVLDYLRSFMEKASDVIQMENLNDMHVKAAEETYSFNLEEAFPAIMMALD